MNIKNIAITLALFTCAACTDSFLDKEYDTSLSDEKVFANQTYTRGYLANLYTFLPDGMAGFSDQQFMNASRDCMTDNAVSYWGLIYYNKVRSDQYTSVDHPLAGGIWNNNFTGIRRCNIFLEKLRNDVVSDVAAAGDDNKLYSRYLAEARLMRAMFHFELVAHFGKTPILDGKIYSVDNDDMLNETREPASDVLQWIADECDAVFEYLPFRYASEGNWGRMSGAAALALKSRALLYKASPLNNSENNLDYWKNAADAAKQFIDANNNSTNPFKLFTKERPTGSSVPSSIVNANQGTLNYLYNFVTLPYNNNEVILSRSTWTTDLVSYAFLPYGSFSGAFGRTNPTQNLIDSYETINGKFIEDDETYNPQKPYENRDPRLDATIFHQGSVWGRPDYGEEKAVDVHFNSASDVGLDYRGDQGGTYTGYYVKKFVNPNIIFNSTYHAAPTTAWIVFRYAEILLNYAEALNEANNAPNADAYDAVNLVRERANMPNLPAGLNYNDFKERIRNERRIELAFEDHRFFDVRRWMLYTVQTSDPSASESYRNHIRKLYSVNVKLNGKTPSFSYVHSDEVSNVVYSAPKNNYYPIPYSETQKVPTLGQNEGW
ncbi:MAG: RagB/SusD family nutrient uptake outer membrane protein [Mangrovibacterium sp.]